MNKLENKQNLLRQLIELDLSMRRRVGEAAEKRQNLQEELELKHRQMKEEYISRARSRVAKVRQSLDEYDTEKDKALDKQLEQSLERLRALFDENHIKWENEIFSRIISTAGGTDAF